MSKTTAWKRFEPTGYELDWAALLSAPLEEFGEGQSRVATTTGAILQEALPHRFVTLAKDRAISGPPARQPVLVEALGGGTGISIKTPQRTIRLNTLADNANFPAHVIEAIILIDQAVVEGDLHPLFFYYDTDHVTDDDHDSFSLFVTNNERIVLDRVTFSRHRNNGFNPAIFKAAYDSSDAVWSSEAAVAEARVGWWFRRFYQETNAGQLTTFRDDAPLYFYVPDWKQQAVVANLTGQIAHGIASIQKLLAFVLVGLGLILFSLWK
jgi:hypothetical protein